MLGERKWVKRESDWAAAKSGTWWPAPLTVARVRPPSYFSTQPATCPLWNQALHSSFILNPIFFMLYLVDVTGTLPSVSPLHSCTSRLKLIIHYLYYNKAHYITNYLYTQIRKPAFKSFRMMGRTVSGESFHFLITPLH